MCLLNGCSRSHDREAAPEPAKRATGAASTADDAAALRSSPLRQRPAAPAASSAALQLTDVATAAGLVFRYDNGAAGQQLMVETTGGGAGWLDYDRDGLLDLFCTQGGDPVDPTRQPPDSLFRQIGESRFDDQAHSAWLTAPGYSQGVTAGDFDNDGFTDLFIANVGPDMLYLNAGDGTFVDITAQAGVGDVRWGTSCAWADLDLDGNLDLFICNYLDYDPFHPIPCPKEDGSPSICQPEHIPPGDNECFRSMGDGTFTPVAERWGLRGPGSKSLGVAIADFDRDNRPDVFIANDTTANFLFQNLSPGRFREAGIERGCALSGSGNYQASMGVAFGDYDRDGWQDLYVTHFSDDFNTLYRNLGSTGFQDETLRTGLQAPTMRYLGFGTVMEDFNADGKQDLFVANGHIDDWRELGDLWHMPPQVFSFHSGMWYELSASAGPYFSEERLGRGVAAGDFDNDGDCDLAVINQNDQAALLRSESPSPTGLRLGFIGTHSNRDGIGVKVELTSNPQESPWFGEVAGGTSYCSSRQPVLFATARSDSGAFEIKVRWPSGRIQELRQDAGTRCIVIREPDASQP